MTASSQSSTSLRRTRSNSPVSVILLQPTKPKQLMKPKLEIRSKKVSVSSEKNAFRTNETSESLKGPLDTSSNSIPSIFVEKTFDEDVHHNWTLKRASPVYDSDADEDFIAMHGSPSKKHRTTLDWGNRLPDENSGFTINL